MQAWTSHSWRFSVRGPECVGLRSRCGDGDGVRVVGSARALAGGGELRHRGVCVDGGVVLFLEPLDGQAGAVAGIDWIGHSVFAGWVVVGEIPAAVDGAGAEWAGRGGDGMSARQKGLVVLAIQLALVLSIGAKYAWERHHCPMVWARAAQVDPSQPLRGRYLAMSLHANGCGLPMGSGTSDLDRLHIEPWQGVRAWHVVPAVRNGQLAPIVVDETRAGPTQEFFLGADVPCDEGMLSGTSDFFVPEHAKAPLPLQKGQELWALVTVPPSGPVRPVKLAISRRQGLSCAESRVSGWWPSAGVVMPGGKAFRQSAARSQRKAGSVATAAGALRPLPGPEASKSLANGAI